MKRPADVGRLEWFGVNVLVRMLGAVLWLIDPWAFSLEMADMIASLMPGEAARNNPTGRSQP